jgi:hypothetical protein
VIVVSILSILLLVGVSRSFFTKFADKSQGGSVSIEGSVTDKNPTGDEEDEDPAVDEILLNAFTNFSSDVGFTTNLDKKVGNTISVITDTTLSENEILDYHKSEAVSNSGGFFGFMPIEEELKAEALVAQFDIYIKSDDTASNPMAFQIYFTNSLESTPFIATVRIASDAFYFGSIQSPVSGGTPVTCTNALAYDTWHTITMKINMSSTEKFKAEFYDGDFKIGESYVFTNYNRDDNPSVNNNVSGIMFRSNSSAVIHTYVDNISIKVGSCKALGISN